MPKRRSPVPKAASAKTKKTASSALLWEEYRHNPVDDVLRVYADALEQEGDPRGPFLQLCLTAKPTEEQMALKAQLLKKTSKKVLGGPGAEHLREIELGPNGLVARARTELDQVLEHIDAIAALNPRLVLRITSLRTLKQAKELAKVPLGGIYFADLQTSSVNDDELEALAPALANVRHLNLPCRGTRFFTPEGLRALGCHLKQLRYLAMEFYPRRGPKASAYAAVIASSPGFATLRGLDLAGATASDFPGRKIVLDTKLFRNGHLSREVLGMIKKQGVEFVDQLEGRLGPVK